MYIIALIRIPLTEMFSKKHLKCQNMVTTGQEVVREKNFFEVMGKSGNFTSSQGKFYGHVIIIIIGHEINNKLMVGFQESRSILHIIVKELSIQVHCMCLAESIN